jgi:GxxExxY protein
MIDKIEKIAKHVYEDLGPGHKDKTYRDALALEMQEIGYSTKIESPVNITYTTKKGNTMIIGSQTVDICAFKDGNYIFIEVKAMMQFFKKPDTENIAYIKIRKYLASIGLDSGVLINFPFPPAEKIEIIDYSKDNHCN